MSTTTGPLVHTDEIDSLDVMWDKSLINKPVENLGKDCIVSLHSMRNNSLCDLQENILLKSRWGVFIYGYYCIFDK